MRSATPGWRPSRWSTSPTATRSGRARSPTSPSCTTATSPTTTGFAAGWRGRVIRFATGNDSEAIAVYIADQLEGGASLEDALRSSVTALDGTFAYLISTPQGIGVARDRFALKPLIFAEDDEIVLIASEEIALRRVSDSTHLVPRELNAGEVRWWLR